MDGDKNFKAVHLKDLYPPDITDIEWIRKLGEEDGLSEFPFIVFLKEDAERRVSQTVRA